MSFPINTGIPAANNNPANDQQPMQQNFANIDGFLTVDHVKPGTVLDGFHKQVHLINESAPGLSGASGVLYANIVSGQSWPIWQNALGSTVMLSGPTTAAINGSTSLAGGIVLKWGQTAIPSGSSSTGSVSFASSGGNFPNSAYVVLPTLVSKVGGTSSSSDTIAVRQNSTSVSGFTWDFNGQSGSYTFFNWIAIGN